MSDSEDLPKAGKKIKPTSDQKSQLDYIRARPALIKLAHRFCLKPISKDQNVTWHQEWEEAALEEARLDREYSKKDFLTDRTKTHTTEYAPSVLDRRDIERIRYEFAEKYVENTRPELWKKTKGYYGTRECKLLLVLTLKLGATLDDYPMSKLPS